MTISIAKSSKWPKLLMVLGLLAMCFIPSLFKTEEVSAGAIASHVDVYLGCYELSTAWECHFSLGSDDSYIEGWNTASSVVYGSYLYAQAAGSRDAAYGATSHYMGYFSGSSYVTNPQYISSAYVVNIPYSTARRSGPDAYGRITYYGTACVWVRNYWSGPYLLYDGIGQICWTGEEDGVPVHYEYVNRTLTGVAVDVNGNSIGLANVSSTVAGGGYASITRRSPPSGYVFKGWRSNRYSGTPSGGATYGATIYNDTTVYAVYEKQVTLTGSAYDTKGRKLSLSDVSSTVGAGSTASITRRGAPSGYVFRGWKSSVNAGSYMSTSATYSERISSNKTVYAIYAKQVTLTGQACDRSGNRITSIADVTRTVDEGSSAEITRRTSEYYTFVGWSNSCGGGIISTSTSYSKTISGNTTVYAIYDKNTFEGFASIEEVDSVYEKIESVGYTTENAETKKMYIKCANNNNSCNIKLNFKIKRKVGNGATSYSITTDTYGPPVRIIDTKGTSYGDERNLSPYENLGLTLGADQCYVFDFIAVPADNKHAVLKVCVAAPYNFENEVVVNLDKNDEEIGAGEKLNPNITIIVKPRENKLVGSSGYATEVPRASYGYEVKVQGREEPLESKSGNDTLNDSQNNSGGMSMKIRDVDDAESKAITIPDIEIGSKVCIHAWIKPQNSGAESNVDPGKFEGEASYDKCYTVAKKPLIEVLGSDMYAAQGVLTNVNEKNIVGDDEYKDNVHVFGSFAEHAVVGLGVITDFSSASAPGQPHGSAEGEQKNFCAYRTLLTIANYPCDGNTTEESGVYADTAIREKVLAYWQNNGNVYNGDTDIYRETIGDLTGTRFVYVKGNATIKEDLIIDGNYTNISEIPKVIIYAERGIEIDCEVGRIDAILIAQSGVNTCNKYKSTDKVNNEIEKRSKLLVVNGTIISDFLTPSRVGGAGTADESNDPAEIVNYDSSILLWEKAMSLGSDSVSNLTTIYQKELAPRY